MCSCSNFFYCCSVSPLWPLAFLIFSHPIRYENFHLFLPTKYVSFAFYLSIYLFPCYPSLTWFSRKKKTRLVVQLPIHPHMDDVYNWQVIIIFHVHKLLPCLSIVSSKYDIWDLLPYMYSCRRWRDVRTVTWLPQFLASISYHFFLPMVLLCAHELHYNLCSMSAKKQEINKKQIAVCITLTVVRTLYNPGNNSPWTTQANYILL